MPPASPLATPLPWDLVAPDYATDIEGAVMLAMLANLGVGTSR